MTKKFIIVVSVPVSNEGRTEWSERVRAIIQGATIFLRASAHECADSREVINGSHVVSLVALSRGNLIAKMQHFALGYAANGFGLLMVPRPLVREVLCAEDVDCLAVPCDVENRPQSARPIRLAEELCALLGEPIVTGAEMFNTKTRLPDTLNIPAPRSSSLGSRRPLSAATIGVRSGVSLGTNSVHGLAEAATAS